MTWDVAKTAIDYILDNEQDFQEDSVIWEFIGGEPFLEIDLIDRICDYIKLELYKREHRWFNNYKLAFTTNGLNYQTDKVQNFIEKNKSHIHVTITIDGTKQKHNINRVYKQSNKGSYDDVVKNIPLWLAQFPNATTKVTISSEDIPYIAESVLHIYELGIQTIHINCVFENVFKINDDILFEEQLMQPADTKIPLAHFLMKQLGSH